MDTVTFANGVIYRTHDALYSGAGSIGVANIRALLTEFDGRVEAWSQLQLHDELRGRPTKYAKLSDRCVHRVPTEDCLLVTDALGSESIYLRCGSAQDGIIDALDDYPVIDDCVVAEVEAEWELIAWVDWIKDKLFRAMRGYEPPGLGGGVPGRQGAVRKLPRRPR